MDWPLVVAIGALAVAVVGLYYKAARDTENDLAATSKSLKVELDAAIKSGDDKRATIWQRFDALKKEHNEGIENLRREMWGTCVPMTTCKVVHESNDKTLERIDKSLERIELQVQHIATQVNLRMKPGS